jgi:hypothetical protein
MLPTYVLPLARLGRLRRTEEGKAKLSAAQQQDFHITGHEPGRYAAARLGLSTDRLMKTVWLIRIVDNSRRLGQRVDDGRKNLTDKSLG